MRKFFGRIQRSPLASSKPEGIDAPILLPELVDLPVGDVFVPTPSFRSKREDSTAELVQLGKVRVSGRSGRIYQRGIWLMEFSWYGGQTFLAPSFQIAPMDESFEGPVEPIAGRTTSTVCTFNNVYGHVLLDEMPLLLHLLVSGEFATFDTIICSDIANRLVHRITHPELDGLLAKLRPAIDGVLYEADDFSAIRRTGCRKNPSVSELNILRAHVETDAFVGSERLYIERDSRDRTVENQSEIDVVLDKYSVTKAKACDLKNPWATFAAADLVIGVSGSDLSDSVFLSRDATLFELHPSDHIQPYNWNVAKKIGFQYISMMVSSNTMRGTHMGPGNSSIRVDPDEFEARLKWLVEHKEQTVDGSAAVLVRT